MAQLLIVYDPNDRISLMPTDQRKHLDVKEAILPVAEDLENSDIYTLARKLAELLLEQL